MQRFVQEQGGRFLCAGDVVSPMIGDVEDLWVLIRLAQRVL